MSVQITGKNIDVGDAFQTFAQDRVVQAVSKYVDSEVSGHIRVEKERGRFLTSCSVMLGSGLSLQTSGNGNDAYASAEAAFDRLETRLRRYQRKLKDHHHSDAMDKYNISGASVDYHLNGAEADAAEDEETPLIVAENRKVIRTMAVSDAVMFLDLSEEPVLVFKNAKHGGHNIVYRRSDGNIGWIDLENEAKT